MIVDCHVNIFNPEQTLPLFHSLTPSSRPGSMGLAADADTIYEAMADVDKAIIFSLRYKDAIGVDGDDEEKWLGLFGQRFPIYKWISALC